MHLAQVCLDELICKFDWMPAEDSLVFHFRDELFQETDYDTIEDKTMWKYKDELIKAVELTLNQTGFKP